MNRKKLGVLMVFASSLGFGLNAMTSYIGKNQGINVSSFLFFRFLLASIIIWTIVYVKKIPFKTTKKHIINLGIVGTMGFGVCATFLFYAYSYIPSSLATLILFAHPSMIIFYETFFKKAPIEGNKLISLFLTIIGLTLVLWNPGQQIKILGIVFSLISALGYTFYCIGLTDKRTSKMNPIAIYGYILTFDCIFNLIQVILGHNLTIPKTFLGVFIILFNSIFCTAIPAVLFYSGLKEIGPSSATLISTYEPVYVSLVGFFFFSEVLTPKFIIGGVFIIISIIVLQLSFKQVKPRET